MEPESDCSFCKLAAEYPGARAITVVPKTKRRRGHRLVIPPRHVPTPFDLTDRELGYMFTQAAIVADGKDVQLRMNVGWRAGQRQEHVHLHVIPR